MEKYEALESGDPVRRPSKVSQCSQSTDERVTGFIERTLSTLSLPESETAVTFLPPKDSAKTLSSENPVFHNAFVSDPFTVVQSLPQDQLSNADDKDASSPERINTLYAVTSYFHNDSGQSDTEPEQNQSKVTTTDRQLAAIRR